MNAYDIIQKKKRGKALTKEEIRDFVSGYTRGEIPDYQASALLMAICLCGMTDAETYELTMAIAQSGDFADTSELGPLTVDKHSTGGVGDKTTLIVAPLAAALGCKVAKMSGRGLGHTGGTVDKLEAFEGYRVQLSPLEFIRQVKEIGIAVISQSGNLAPADKKLYALRDVTATVDSIPLITSSIMGKKLPSGAGTIVLDVKYGSGAFMKTTEEAEALAEKMVKIGKLAGRNTAALITDMDTPLGYAVGNTLEVKEAIATLCGRGPSDLTEICIALAGAMAHLALGISYEEACRRAKELLLQGAALQKFKEWILAQGGDTALIDNPDKFESAKYKKELKCNTDGYIFSMDAEKIGLSAMELGAGRKTKDDAIDYSAGIILAKKTGDRVMRGDVLATLYSGVGEISDEALSLISDAYKFSDTQPKKRNLIHKIIF